MSVTEPLPDIREFSEGYYLVRGFFVEPSERVHEPLVNEQTYAWLQEQYYRERSTPILFRKNDAGYHFEIHPREDVAIDVIQMPFELVDDLGLDLPPEETPLMMAKPRHAHNLYRMSNPDTTTIEG